METTTFQENVGTVMNILDKVKCDGLIFDGAMGSMLMQAGLVGGKASEVWNLENPEAIEKIHQAYFEAGADVATVNTFGGSAFKLSRMGVTDQMDVVAQINAEAVKIARKAIKSVTDTLKDSKPRYIAGDIGPLGEMLQPGGLMSVEEATSHYADQARVLADAGVDFFIAETFFDINEILAAIKGIRQVSNLPIFATMTFQQKPNGFFTIMGNKPVQSLTQLLDAGASVVGANCSIASDTMIDLAKEIREGIDAPIMAQPNAGTPQVDGEMTTYPETADYFSDNIKNLKEVGVDVVGGCCGTTPAFIRSIRDKIFCR